MFGQQQGQSNLFGSTPQSQSNLFGGGAATPAAGFGAAATPATGFGATPAAGFGAASTPATGFGATPAAGFGAPSTPATGFGATPAAGFGSATPATGFRALASAATNPALAFGAASTPATGFGAPASQPGLFGAPAASAPSLFGGAPAASAPSLFGGGLAQPSPSGTSLFGAPTPQSAYGQPTPDEMKLPSSVTDLVEKLNPSHPDSRFHATLYRVEDPALVPRHTRPAGMTEREFSEAQMNNPDPSRLVPVQAKLFDDLLGRAAAQETRVQQNNRILLNIQRAVTTIEESVDGDLQPRLAAYRRRHRELARRVLKIASKVELAACRGDASGALSMVEVDHKRRLDALSQALTAPGEFKYKLCDLVELSQSSAIEGKEAFAGDLRDPKAAAAVKTLLSEQLRGIQHLNEVCAKIKRDTEIIAERVMGGGS